MKGSSPQSGGRILTALLGKKIVFQGKFERGERDQLAAMAEAQQGTVADDLDSACHILVLANVTAGKTVQKKVQSLNAKGASIQVLDKVDFLKLVQPTRDQIVGLIRGGKANADLLLKGMGLQNIQHVQFYGAVFGGRFKLPTSYTIAGESFDRLDLSGIRFHNIVFENCSFVEAILSAAVFSMATHCDFSDAKLDSCTFADVDHSRFSDSDLTQAKFFGSIASADFSNALMRKTSFFQHRGVTQQAQAGLSFRKANLNQATFSHYPLDLADFSGADLTNAVVSGCGMERVNFEAATLTGAALLACKLNFANFTNADLASADLADSDLSDARLDGANLSGVTLFNTRLDRVDLTAAKNYNPTAPPRRWW